MALNQYTQLATLDQNAVITQYSRKLRRKAIPRDIYTNLRADHVIYQNEQMAIPNAIYTVMSGKDTAGANSVRVTLKLPLNGNVLTGRTLAIGTEIAPVIRTGTLYRAPYRIVIQDKPGYGEDKLDAEPYRLYETHVEDLHPHARAQEGLEIRMALVESNSWILQQNPSTQAVAPAQWNRNFYVIGATLANQPAFHPNFATYTNRIVAQMDAVSGGAGAFTQTQAQMLTGTAIDNIIRWAFRRRMMPLTIGGRSSFVLTISQLAAARFSDPRFVDSMGNRWTTSGQIDNGKVQNWHGILGKYESPNATVYIVVDDRLPTLLPGGTSEPYSLQAGYIWPTDNDLRNLDNPLVRDAMILHGSGALVNWEPEKLHLIADNYDYNVRNGKGYAGVRGVQQLQFDTTPADATGASREYFGSAVIVAGRWEGAI